MIIGGLLYLMCKDTGDIIEVFDPANNLYAGYDLAYNTLDLSNRSIVPTAVNNIEFISDYLLKEVAYFNGVDSNIVLPINALNVGDGNYTISFMINTGELQEDSCIIDFGDTTTDRLKIFTGTSSDIPGALKYVSTISEFSNYTPNDSWLHYIITRRSGTVSIFCNGVLDRTFTDNVSIGDGDNSITIGSTADNTNFIKGKLARLRFYSSAYSAEDVINLNMYELEQNPLITDKVHHLTQEVLSSDNGITFELTRSTINNSDNEAFKSFDKVTNAVGWFGDEPNDEWLQVNFKLTKVSPSKLVLIAEDSYLDANPKDFKVQGSNDNINFVDLLSVTDEPTWSANEIREYDISSSEFYRHIRLYLVTNQGRSTSSTFGSEVELHGKSVVKDAEDSFTLDNMTEDIVGDIEVIAESIDADDNGPCNAFNTNNSYWFSKKYHRITWLDYIIHTPNKAFIPIKYKIRARNESDKLDRMPKSFLLLGSVDGLSWCALDERYDVTWVAGEYNEYNVNRATQLNAYNHFRLQIFENDGSNWECVAHMSIEGIPGCALNNTSEIRLISPFTLTSNTSSDDFVITRSSVWDSGHEAYHLFNHDVSNKWATADDENTGWVTIEFTK
jgi:hypothetical protein